MRIILAREHREHILRSMKPGTRMLEWGSGGSTLWFADRLPEGATLTSVEHHAEWHRAVCGAVGERANVRLVHAPGDVPLEANATIEEEDATHLGRFVHAADTPAFEGHAPGFDVIFVDGLARSACLERARSLLNPGGTVFLHDAQRPWYDEAKSQFIERDTIGPGEDYTGPILWSGGLDHQPARGSASASPLVVSFYTVGTPYEDEVANLRRSCEELGLDHHLSGIPCRGSWEHNQSHKPRFIREAMDLFDRPVLWVDADAVLRSAPRLLSDHQPDFAIHKVHGWVFASGTVYINRTRLARLLLDRWIEFSEADHRSFDQHTLDAAWESVVARHPLRTRWLPQTYTKIFDHADDQHFRGAAPVIEHFQASRRTRPAPEGGGMRVHEPGEDLKQARLACRPRNVWYDERYVLVDEDPAPCEWRELIAT